MGKLPDARKCLAKSSTGHASTAGLCHGGGVPAAKARRQPRRLIGTLGKMEWARQYTVWNPASSRLAQVLHNKARQATAPVEHGIE